MVPAVQGDEGAVGQRGREATEQLRAQNTPVLRPPSARLSGEMRANAQEKNLETVEFDHDDPGHQHCGVFRERAQERREPALMRQNKVGVDHKLHQ